MNFKVGQLWRTSDSRVATIVYISNDPSNAYPVVGIVDGLHYSWNVEGGWRHKTDSVDDFNLVEQFVALEPSKVSAVIQLLEKAREADDVAAIHAYLDTALLVYKEREA